MYNNRLTGLDRHSRKNVCCTVIPELNLSPYKVSAFERIKFQERGLFLGIVRYRPYFPQYETRLIVVEADEVL